jgi:hypothetical protein
LTAPLSVATLRAMKFMAGLLHQVLRVVVID